MLFVDPVLRMGRLLACFCREQNETNDCISSHKRGVINELVYTKARKGLSHITGRRGGWGGGNVSNMLTWMTGKI